MNKAHDFEDRKIIPVRKAREILETLKKTYPQVKSELNYSTPFELLIATILSAQCTDKRVNEVTKSLFQKYKSPEDYLRSNPGELEKDIHSTGFYRNKARSLRGTCQLLLEKFHGEVPKTLEELITLPGVGRKTANVVLGHVYGIPSITTDTHVIRLSNRLGFTRHKNPVKVEMDLQKIFPSSEWTTVCDTLIFHGRRCCFARKPNCQGCPVLKDCPQNF